MGRPLTMLLMLTFCLGISVFAQKPSDTAVLLANDAVFDYKGPTQATYSRTFTIMIPDKSAEKYSVFSCDVNNGRTKLKSFSGEIEDATGKKKKLKKADLKYTEFSEGLADSYGTFYYSPTLTSYPSTITYSYEISYSDAVLSFIPFEPLPFTNGVALESATYTLRVPSEDCFSYRTLNMPGVEPERFDSPDGVTLKWAVKDIPAGVSEPHSPPVTSILRAVLFTPVSFTYEGNAGTGDSWVSLGNWIESLSDGFPDYPKELEEKVKSLTEGCETDFEKLEKIHKYLGETTRYVSIQLGLGGLRPLDPAYVFKNKFGDCKALSWYMKSMLECCGIPSDYVIVNMGADSLIPDFPSLATANHAILSVPIQGDTLWVECTDPEVPLGYVHAGIAGNHALIVKKDGSYVTRLPELDSRYNTDSIIANVTLDPDGGALASVKQVVCGMNWETAHALSKLSSDKQADFVKSGFSVPMVKVYDLTINDFPLNKPFCETSYKASASTYASKTGARLFVPADPFRYYPDNTSRTRKNDIYFGNGWVDSDVITLSVPEGYVVESSPENVVFDNQFGHMEYGMTFNEDSRVMTIKLSVQINKGLFPKEEYSDYKAFRKVVEKVSGGKIVLVKR